VNTRYRPRPALPSTSVLITASASLTLSLLGGCTTAPVETLADGSALRELIVQQTHDPGASARNGTTPPAGTDPDVANASVQAVRAKSGRESSGTTRSNVLDALSGSRSR